MCLFKLLYIYIATIAVNAYVGPYDIPTGFCYDRQQQDKCCESRDDDCGVPDRGTTCYCDKFCSTSKDCCTDVKQTCYGIKPEPVQWCTMDGTYYKPGETIKVYCNTCTCHHRGTTMNWDCTMNTCIIDDMIVDELKQIQNDWTPDKSKQFWHWTLKDGMERALGTNYISRKVASTHPKHISVRPHTLPKFFDARERWPGKITSPPDQSGCGGSWAFSTVSVASDRWNIMSNDSFHGSLSVQHLVACNLGNRPGCSGGRLTKGWSWINAFGLVKDEAYRWNGGTRCHLTKRKGAKTTKFINSDEKINLYYTSPVYRISRNEYQIMKEIMDNGPVQATMDIFRDFFLYKSGIYNCPKQYKRNQNLNSVPKIEQYPGYHSVRIVGWGEEHRKYDEPLKYWIVSNSWGTSWGENGYFRIRRGVNSCKIEDFILAVWIHKN